MVYQCGRDWHLQASQWCISVEGTGTCRPVSGVSVWKGLAPLGQSVVYQCRSGWHDGRARRGAVPVSLGANTSPLSHQAAGGAEDCWPLACFTSQQHAGVSQGRIGSDESTCCHTEIGVADQTLYLTQSQLTERVHVHPVHPLLFAPSMVR